MKKITLGIIIGSIITIIILYFIPFNTGIKNNLLGGSEEKDTIYCPRIYGKCYWKGRN